MCNVQILVSFSLAGASSGIGSATAKLFARLGAQLTITGRNADNLHKVAEECKELSEGKTKVLDNRKLQQQQNFSVSFLYLSIF